MSLFSIGGNLGVALGALVTAPLLLLFGRPGGLLLAVPCARGRRAARRLVGVPRRLRAGAATDASRWPARIARRACPAPRRDRLRSVGWFGLLTFVPLWAVSLGHSEAYGNNLLALMLFAGGVGTLAAGPLADRIGRRPVLSGQPRRPRRS